METHIARLTTLLGAEVQDPEQDTFLLYAQPLPSHDLGFVDAKAAAVQVEVGGRGVTVEQAPGVLASRRAGGTTGAVLWRTSLLVAQWLATHPVPLATLLPPRPAILELGCGVSPCIALALHRLASLYVLSDQPYIHRVLARNLAAAAESPLAPSSKRSSHSSFTKHSSTTKHSSSKHASKHSSSSTSSPHSSICFRPLDWETDAVTPALAHPHSSFDALIACDCIYNEALVAPFVQTCVDVCRLRNAAAASTCSPTTTSFSFSSSTAATRCVCIVAQQLRSHDVFLEWLAAFHAAFHVWQMPSSLLPPDLHPSAGFVVHIGILRDSPH